MGGMSVWAWARSRVAPKPKPYVRNPRPYGRVAPHIRGRVFALGPTHWGMEVINTNTGKVLASDNCSRYQATLDCCDEATAAARAAWFWDFRRKAVQ